MFLYLTADVIVFEYKYDFRCNQAITDPMFSSTNVLVFHLGWAWRCWTGPSDGRTHGTALACVRAESFHGISVPTAGAPVHIGILGLHARTDPNTPRVYYRTVLRVTVDRLLELNVTRYQPMKSCELR